MRKFNFAYITLEHDSNMFTVSNASDCIEELKQLKRGDRLNIKGIGEIVVATVYSETVKSNEDGEHEYVYTDVEVVCNYPRSWS